MKNLKRTIISSGKSLKEVKINISWNSYWNRTYIKADKALWMLCIFVILCSWNDPTHMGALLTYSSMHWRRTKEKHVATGRLWGNEFTLILTRVQYDWRVKTCEKYIAYSLRNVWRIKIWQTVIKAYTHMRHVSKVKTW